MSTTAPDRELLLKVYDAALAEYRFNVQLTWERTRFFLLLNVALIAAGAGLFRIGTQSVPSATFLVIYFLLLILIALFGSRTIESGKAYYREAMYRKTPVERELGLLDALPDSDRLPQDRRNLSIAVTAGQRDWQTVLYGNRATSPDKARALRVGSVAFQTRRVFHLIMLIDGFGAVIAAAQLAMLLTASGPVPQNGSGA